MEFLGETNFVCVFDDSEKISEGGSGFDRRALAPRSCPGCQGANELMSGKTVLMGKGGNLMARVQARGSLCALSWGVECSLL